MSFDLTASLALMSSHLHHHTLFTQPIEFLSQDERVALSYQRARLLLRTHGLSATDVQYCTSKFWGLMTDPILARDIATFTIIAAHVGLAIGTLSRHLNKRPDLRPLVNKLLRLDTVGLFLLSERGHGLDAFNIETTATKTRNGYVLHSPREEAWKFMPASTPSFGIPKVALVMAQVIVDGQKRGCRWFIVPICNEREMFKGVTSIRLPPRTGTSPLDFAITSFNQVQLPHTALVSSDLYNLSVPRDPLAAWWNEIWRIQLGTLAVSAPLVSAMKAIAFIGTKYSTRRTILGKGSEPTPIIAFRTQQVPMLNALACSIVMDTWCPRLIDQAMYHTKDSRIRHALSVVLKATVCRHFQRIAPDVSERCGAQGTFEQNYMVRIENDSKGIIIAEGDVLTLCIRLFSELLQGKYSIPLPDKAESLLAEHATSMLDENRQLLVSFGSHHRCEEFNSLILPEAEAAIQAIGHALAYSAGVKAGLPQEILDLYECSVIKQDPAWYSEHGISRMEQRLREDRAVTRALPHVETYLAMLNIEDYVDAPIVSDASWLDYLSTLPTYRGNAVPTVEESFQAQAML